MKAGAADLRIAPGRPGPLGATWDGEAVHFAVWSPHASRIDLCVYDSAGIEERARLELPGRDAEVWHGRLEGAGPGTVYGYRAHGEWAPARGHRFNPAKLLLDPWAREIVGTFGWRPELQGADAARPDLPDARDSGPWAPKARVVADAPRPEGAPLRRVAADDLVLYELHVKGFSRLNPAVPAPLRGTYAGLAHPASLAHLERLGVNAVCLLPVHQHLDERRLAARGLVNYWGYNTLGFFCPEPRYAAARDAAGAREEFRAMVDGLHARGIEVVLDVVFNHTCETDDDGPTLSWRGLDNASWYRLTDDPPRRCVNDTGCGNTLDLRQPGVLRFVMDSLRYWVQAMHVDGFRFDLATVLGRGDAGFDSRAPFFAAVAQDPVLAGARLIAEPWDVGPGGYRLGGFPPGWLEWNDRFRDGMRDWWLCGRVTRGEFARRLCASADVFQRPPRQPAESVNYLASHDGFTLRDAVSYRERRNQANGEDNRDGSAGERSANFGVEGDTDDPGVVALRNRARRALMATLLLAQGTPMIAAGDEIGHTQGGNNNPYCQDNETTWIDWPQADRQMADFTARVLALRRTHRPLGPRWTTGRADARGVVDLAWIGADGAPLGEADWHRSDARVLGAWIGAPSRGRTGGDWLLLFNASAEACRFELPAGRWRVLLDSTQPDGRPPDAAEAHGAWPLPGGCVVMMAGGGARPDGAEGSAA